MDHTEHRGITTPTSLSEISRAPQLTVSLDALSETVSTVAAVVEKLASCVMRHVVRSVVVVGVAPWLLATVIYGALLSFTGGWHGIGIAVCDVLTRPLVVLPLCVGGAYVWAESRLLGQLTTREARGWLGGIGLGIVAITLTGLVGFAWDGDNGLTWLIRWGMGSGYAVFVGVAAALLLAFEPAGRAFSPTGADLSEARPGKRSPGRSAGPVIDNGWQPPARLNV